LAERLEARIVHPRRQRDGHRLVRSEHRCRRLGWRLRLGKDRHGREHAREHQRSRDDMGGGEAWMPPRDVSQGSEEGVSAGFSPLYGKKRGAGATMGWAVAAGVAEWAPQPSTHRKKTGSARVKDSGG